MTPAITPRLFTDKQAADYTLGPATENRLAEAFGAKPLLPANATADLLGVDVKTLRDMTNSLLIRATRVGKVRRYAEADVRAYLAEAKAEAEEPKPGPRPPMMPRGPKVVPFSQLKGRKRERVQTGR